MQLWYEVGKKKAYVSLSSSLVVETEVKVKLKK